MEEVASSEGCKQIGDMINMNIIIREIEEIEDVLNMNTMVSGVDDRICGGVRPKRELESRGSYSRQAVKLLEWIGAGSWEVSGGLIRSDALFLLASCDASDFRGRAGQSPRGKECRRGSSCVKNGISDRIRKENNACT